jgi:hypothetical protein
MDNINSHTIIQCITVIHSISRKLGSIAADVGVDFNTDIIELNDKEKAELVLAKTDELRDSLFQVVRALDVVTDFYSLLID